MHFDSITAEHLFTTGGSKWAQYGDAYGAFVAEMDFGLAEPIKQTLHQMVDNNLSGYLSPVWVERLKQATVGLLDRRYGWQVEPRNVLLGPDVLTGLTITMRHHIALEAKVIVPTPAYMPFMFLPQRAGHELVQVPMLRTESGWELDYDAIDAAFGEGDLFVLCNPHNPIGKMYSRDELDRLSQIVDKHHGRVFNDEIHAPVTLFGNQHVNYPTVNEVAAAHTLTATSASKAWNIAGYKCSQLILNDADLANAADFEFDLHGTATPGVLATTTAYTECDDWLAEVLTYLEGNHQVVLDAIDSLPGARFLPNQATYLAWIDFPDRAWDCSTAEFFLREAKVALTDGALCGENGRTAIRLNFGTPRPVLVEMLERLGKALSR